MSKQNPKKNLLKQSTLSAFVTSKSSESSGMKKCRQIIMNVLVNLNLKSRIGMKAAKTIHFVSAVPEAETSSNTSEAHSSTSVTGTIDSTTVNLNVTVNVTTDEGTAGK